MGDLEDKTDNLKDSKEVSTMFTATVERYKKKGEAGPEPPSPHSVHRLTS